MSDEFKELDDSLAKWVAAQPLKTEDHDRLWKKFRLEWNFNSNHIEGNTLTYGETELLLIQGQTTGNHGSYRDNRHLRTWAAERSPTHIAFDPQRSFPKSDDLPGTVVILTTLAEISRRNVRAHVWCAFMRAEGAGFPRGRRRAAPAIAVDVANRAPKIEEDLERSPKLTTTAILSKVAPLSFLARLSRPQRAGSSVGRATAF